MASNAITRDSSTLANKYEVLLLEKGGQRLTEERTSLVFQILDDLLPNLGVYTKVLKSARDEIFDSVYSDKYTSTSDDGESFVQRIPYFKLVQDIYYQRNERADEIQQRLDIVKRSLFEKHKQFEDAQDRISDLESNITKLNENIENLETNLEAKQDRIESLEKTLKDDRQSSEKTQHNLKCDITELKADLKEARSEVAFLTKYKKGYDDLESAFTEPIGGESAQKKPIVATKRAHLINNTSSAKMIESQILVVQNAVIEEYDKFLESHKQELINQPVYEDPHDPKYIRSEGDIERADQELWAVEERFKTSCNDIDTELELIRQHYTMLEEQLQIIEEQNPTIQMKKKTLKETVDNLDEAAKDKDRDNIRGLLKSVSRPETQDSVLSAGLNEKSQTDNEEDPFITHERVFSKYASMMYSSSNKGKNWHEFPDAKYCASCGEKTMICPHKLGTKERVIRIPHGSSHIKITRPKVKINKELVTELIRRESTTESEIDLPTSATSKSSKTKRLKSISSMLGKVGASNRAIMFDQMSTASTPSIDAHLVHSLGRLWDDYKDRTTLQRVIPKPLRMDRVLSLIEQFYSFMIWQDETGQDDDEGLFSPLDNLYYFMSQRYHKPDISYLAMSDLFTTIIEISATSKIIHTFGHILVGNLDGAVFRYLLLMCDFINLVQWRDVGDFRVFASIIYPTLGDDDIETLHMGYTSYSENKISKRRVIEFIIYLVLKYREPRFQELESKLVQQSTVEAGHFSFAEFTEALEQVLPVHNDTLCRRLFWEAEAHLRWDNMENVVTISRLAQITGFLGLMQISHIIKQTVAVKVADAREQDPDRQGLPSQVPPGDDSIMTYTAVRGLAINVHRRNENRKKRQVEEEELYS